MQNLIVIAAKFPDTDAINFAGYWSADRANDSIRRALSTNKRRPEDVAKWARIATSQERAAFIERSPTS